MAEAALDRDPGKTGWRKPRLTKGPGKTGWRKPRMIDAPAKRTGLDRVEI